MQAHSLLTELEFHKDHAFAQPLLVDEHARILRFMLQPGQSINEHTAPHSPFYVVILQGKGIFSGADGIEQEFRSNTLLAFDMAEVHSVRALDETLVFLGFLQGVSAYGSETRKIVG